MGLILIVLLVILLLGVFPSGPAPWAANMGYGPSGILGVILVVVLILFLMGRIH